VFRNAYLKTTAAVCRLARVVPMAMAPKLESLAIDMVAAATHFKRMDRRECKFGQPFVAYAQCEDMNCRHCWTVVSLGDVHPDNDLACPVCEQNSGGLL
jgi:hypothetical protein